MYRRCVWCTCGAYKKTCIMPVAPVRAEKRCASVCTRCLWYRRHQLIEADTGKLMCNRHELSLSYDISGDHRVCGLQMIQLIITHQLQALVSLLHPRIELRSSCQCINCSRTAIAVLPTLAAALYTSRVVSMTAAATVRGRRGIAKLCSTKAASSNFSTLSIARSTCSNRTALTAHCSTRAGRGDHRTTALAAALCSSTDCSPDCSSTCSSTHCTEL